MTAYSAILEEPNCFAVEAQSTEGRHVVGGFKTEAAAIAWMIEKQKVNERDECGRPKSPPAPSR